MNAPYTTAKTYEYFKKQKFSGVSGTPPTMGAGDWWTYHWVGIHPKTPYIEHSIEVSPKFTRLFVDATHQIRIEVTRVGTNDRKLLYTAQLDLSRVEDVNLAAQQLAIALVLYLLRQANPAAIPGICDIRHSSQVSRWSIALRETIKGMDSKVLRD